MSSSRWREPVLGLVAVAVALLALRAVAPVLAPPPPVGRVAPLPDPTPSVVLAPPGLQVRPSADLLLAVEDGLLRVDLDTGAVRAITLPGPPRGLSGGLLQRDGTVVAVRDEIAYMASDRLGRPAVSIGPASYALASPEPRRVWLVEQTGDPDRWFRVREVELAGHGSGRPTIRVLARGALQLSHRPVAGVPGGLLVAMAGPGGGLGIWDPRTGMATRRLDAGTPAAVAASGRTVAWVEKSTLHLADLLTRWHRVVPAAGGDGFAAAVAFSPDGRRLAAVTRVGLSTRPALAVVTVDKAVAVRVAGSDGALSDGCSPCLAWAAAGDWVFFSRLGPGFGIGAYRLGQPRAVTLSVEVPGSLPPRLASI